MVFATRKINEMLPTVTETTFTHWTPVIVPLHEMTLQDAQQQLRADQLSAAEASPQEQNSTVFAQQLPFRNYSNFLLPSSANIVSLASATDNNHHFLFLNNIHDSNNNNTNCRSTKSQSKQRRDLINAELNHVRDLLPMTKSSRQRLSQLQVMACNNCYIRKCNYWLTAPLDQANGYRHDETLYSFEFGKAMSSFYIICTSNGKLLTIGDNTIDALGQSFEDLLAHGDCIHDLIYREDVLALRSMLELWPDNAIMRTTLVRINPARSVRRQGKYGEYKIIFVRGSFTRLTPYYLATSPFGAEPVFLAECMPLLSPENREVLLHTATELFAALLDRRGAFVGIDERACTHLNVARTDLIGLTIYDMIEDEESLREMQQIHKKILSNEDEHSVWALLRLRSGNINAQRRPHTIYVHALLQHQQQPPTTLTAPTPLPNATTRKSQRVSVHRRSASKLLRTHRRKRSTKSGGTSSNAAVPDDEENDKSDSDNNTDSGEDDKLISGPSTVTTGRNNADILFTLTCQVLSASEALLLQHNRQLIYTSLQTTAAVVASAPVPLDEQQQPKNDDEDDTLDEELPLPLQARDSQQLTMPSSAGFVLHDETSLVGARPQFVPAYLPQNNSGSAGIEDAACAAAYLSALGVQCPYVPLPPLINCISQPLAATNATSGEETEQQVWQQHAYNYYHPDISSTSGTALIVSDAINGGSSSSTANALAQLNDFNHNVEQFIVTQTNPPAQAVKSHSNPSRRRSLSPINTEREEIKPDPGKTVSRSKRQHVTTTRYTKKLTTRNSASALLKLGSSQADLSHTQTISTSSASMSYSCANTATTSNNNKSSTSPTSSSAVKPLTPNTSGFATHPDFHRLYADSQIAGEQAHANHYAPIHYSSATSLEGLSSNNSKLRRLLISNSVPSSTHSASVVVVTAAGTTLAAAEDVNSSSQFATLQAATVEPHSYQNVYEANPYLTLHPFYPQHHQAEQHHLLQPAPDNSLYLQDPMLPCYLISQSQPPLLLSNSSDYAMIPTTAYSDNASKADDNLSEQQPFTL